MYPAWSDANSLVSSATAFNIHDLSRDLRDSCIFALCYKMNQKFGSLSPQLKTLPAEMKITSYWTTVTRYT